MHWLQSGQPFSSNSVQLVTLPDVVCAAVVCMCEHLMSPYSGVHGNSDMWVQQQGLARQQEQHNTLLTVDVGVWGVGETVNDDIIVVRMHVFFSTVPHREAHLAVPMGTRERAAPCSSK